MNKQENNLKIPLNIISEVEIPERLQKIDPNIFKSSAIGKITISKSLLKKLKTECTIKENKLKQLSTNLNKYIMKNSNNKSTTAQEQIINITRILVVSGILFLASSLLIAIVTGEVNASGVGY